MLSGWYKTRQRKESMIDVLRENKDPRLEDQEKELKRILWNIERLEKRLRESNA